MGVSLLERNVGFRFYATEYGSSHLIEMKVQYTFRDEEENTFLVFTTVTNSHVYYLRRYEGNIDELLFFHVDNDAIYDEIEECLFLVLNTE